MSGTVRAAVPAVLLLAATAAAADRVAFPADPAAVIDAKKDLGAKGDGVADDTEALQKGLDLSSGFNRRTTKALYLPNGTYRVTKTLVVRNALGPWLYGESRDGVVVKLADGSKGVTCVLRTHPIETGPTSADWFMRNVRNLTVDAGDNPEADGIRWYATNSGCLQNVRVTGNGKVGINSGFLDQNGPNLVQDVEVDGFETGILSQWHWSQTLSRVTVKNCRTVGLSVEAAVVAAEDLVVENTPLAVDCRIPKDWHWWGGVVVLHGGRFAGGDPTGPAVRNRSVLYARDLKTTGFKVAVASTSPSGDAAGPDVAEYSSHPPRQQFDNKPGGLRLPVEREPAVPWEADPAKWVCANDFGAVAGDNKDDTAAIQKAVDAAAKAGKTTVYFRGCGGPDPNHYTLDGEVKVYGTVRHVLGLGFGRLIGGPGGRLVVTDDSAPVVKFQNIDAFGGSPITVENRSKGRAVVLESCGVKALGTGTGDLFMTDCPSLLDLRAKAGKAWCRQLNPEGDSDDGLVKNAGADLWVLGMKNEGRGVRVATSAGGRAELFGAFVYGPGVKPDDRRPIFLVKDAALGFYGLREIAFDVPTYPVKVREARGKETKEIGTVPGEHGWVGWSEYRGWGPGRK